MITRQNKSGRDDKSGRREDLFYTQDQADGLVRLPLEVARQIRQLVRLGGDVVDPKEFLQTAVDAACRFHDLKIVRLMVKFARRLAAVNIGLSVDYLRWVTSLSEIGDKGTLLRSWSRAAIMAALVSVDDGRQFVRNSSAFLRPLVDLGLAAALSRFLNAASKTRFSGITRALSLIGGPDRVWRGKNEGSRVLNAAVQLIGLCPDAVVYFLENGPYLLHELGPFRWGRWFRLGLLEAAAGPSHGTCYFSLVSVNAKESLDKVRGGLPLDRVKAYLTLYAQVHAGCHAELTTGGPERIEITDQGVSITLPGVARLFRSERGNTRFFRVKAAEWANRARWNRAVPDLDSITTALRSRNIIINDVLTLDPKKRFFNAFPYPRLAERLFELVEFGRTIAELKTSFPGLKEDLAKVYNRLIKEMGQPDLTRPADAVLTELRKSLMRGRLSDSLSGRMGTLVAVLNGRIQAIERQADFSVEDAVILTVDLYQLVAATGYRPSELSSFEASHGQIESNPRGAMIEDTTEPDWNRALSSPSRPFWRHAGIDRFKGLPPALDAVSPAPNTNLDQDRKLFSYDEWDTGIGDYKKGWCSVSEGPATEADSTKIYEIIARYKNTIAAVRRTFQLLMASDTGRMKYCLDGSEVDLDAIVDVLSSMTAGLNPELKVYNRWLANRRNICAGFLLDISESTSRPISAGSPTTVFEVARAALVVMSCALEVLGDPYLILAFSGNGREVVRVDVIKEFEESFGRVAGRLAGLSSSGQNRDGAAIRHTITKLKAFSAKTRVLFLLTDGRPEDYNYESEYGREDTRMALVEARHHGIKTVCVTSDKDGLDYLPRVYGPGRYIIVDEPSSLPRRLPEIYRRLTT
ncbi:MAG: hypothetical protein HQK58_11880 [Deltaproteobacteria bacterium]|nr:hypothetical protein [Deltaproteobacteria bacterium]